MNRSTLRRTASAGVAIIALSMGMAACGSDDDSAGDSTGTTTSSSSAPMESDSPMTSDSPSMSGDASGSTADAAAQTFGDGCSAIPTSGKGSFNGMVTDPVATAASNNPLLKTLVAAVTQAGLADTLNAAPALTVFAPTDDAFAKIPAAQLKKVLADKATLTAILSHHVVEGKLDPSQVVGTHKTLNGDTITIDGDATSGMTVDGGTANVICGNIPTANATVYVIDSVLMPTGK
jgi:uncharacterized surface protein with fasciclin (FAS1) repeats